MSTDQLSLTFAALADPTRRGILARLAQGESNVAELAEPFSISLPAISRHLKVLERAGLIARRREGKARPSELVAAPLAEASEWLEPYSELWQGRLDRLGDHLRSIEAKGNAHE